MSYWIWAMKQGGCKRCCPPLGTWPHLRVPWHCVQDEYKILCVMRGRAFEWGPHSEDSSPATAGLGSSKPCPQAWGRSCLPHVPVALPPVHFPSPSARQPGWFLHLTIVFIFPLPLGTLCSGGFGVWTEKGWFCLSWSRTVGSVAAVERPWLSKRFFFFNLRFSVYHRIELCTALSINFMFYESSVLWTRNPGTQTMCFILANTAATRSQDPVLLTR